MAYGVQAGLENLLPRREKHRIVFVLTDGCPESSHIPVINHQIAQAKKKGIKIVGIGLGSDSEYVKDLFPDHVWARSMEELPQLLTQKLGQLLGVR